MSDTLITKAPRRYAYEALQAELERFAYRARQHAFRHALQMLRWTVVGIAVAEEATSRPSEQAMAFAWEDVDVAFRGYGSSVLTGAVLGLWAALDDEEEADFMDCLQHALATAESLTPRGSKRRHLKKYRDMPLMGPHEVWDRDMAVPRHGPDLECWAIDNDVDPSLASEMFNLDSDVADDDALKHVPGLPNLILIEGGIRGEA